MSVADILDSEFNELVLAGKGLILVDFWATWCGPCKMLVPILEKFTSENSERIKVVKMDIDLCPDTATQFNIRSAPTLAMFRGGKLLEIKRGIMAKGQLIKWMESLEA